VGGKEEIEMTVSNGFMVFGQEAPQAARAFGGLVEALAGESALDEKTQHLAYLAVLAATGELGGVGSHVGLAGKAGASRAEILSATLVGLPAVGLKVLDALAVAAEALDAQAQAADTQA
jgi:4-carboxymuconolactone decarboxylase